LYSSRGGLLSTKNGESPSFPPLVKSTKIEESFAVTPQVKYSFLPSKNGWFSSFPPLVDNPHHILLLWRVLEKSRNP